ncbi:LysR family transcriptional regulator [Dellaglioa sp. L3N]
METRILNYFLKIAQLGNMSKAANELHITQPTLSRQLKNLENLLETPLFNRDNKKMTLTNSGIIFQERAQQIVSLIEKSTQDVINNDALNGTIAIGCVESSVAKFLGAIIMAFHEQYPNIKFSLYNADGDDIKEKIDSGRVDLGFLLSPVEVAKYEFIKLPVTDNWGIVVPKNTSIAIKTSINTAELTSLPLIIPARSIVQNEVASWANIPTKELTIVGSQNLLSNALYLVKEKLGYALCASGAYLNRPDTALNFIPLSSSYKIKHMMAWKKNQKTFTAVQIFIDFVKEHYLSH